MEKNINEFILAGNGSYKNRGCEAIFRGTEKILNTYFDNPKLTNINFYSSTEQFLEESAKENKKNVLYKKTYTFSHKKIDRILNRILMMSLDSPARARLIYNEILPDLEKNCAVLAVGGDNYSLDYGKPTIFVDLDNLVLLAGKPLIIWGASVGPFSKDKKFESFMQNHLKKITGIFARDSITLEYLNSIGVYENVYRVADPAFLLNPVEPSDEKFSNKKDLGDFIGVNLSPLMSKFMTEGDSKKWEIIAVEIIKKIAEKTKKPIYLIPHVTSAGKSDYKFMEGLLPLLKNMQNTVKLLPDNLTASETKWVISKLFAFVGSRTHSVIASLSSLVPTLSLSYSIKGRGIIKDFFGDEYFSVSKEEFTPEIISEKMKELVVDKVKIKNQIASNLPRIQDLSMDAGKYLKNIINLYK